MMSRFRVSLVPLLAICILVAGCGDDSTGPTTDDPSGSLRFTSSGAISGTFNVQGTVRTNASGEPEFGTWAAADRSPSNDLTIAGFQARTAPNGDLFALAIASATAPRTVQICAEENCPGGSLFVTGLNTQSDNLIFDRVCFLTDGTIDLQAIDNDRARGTFEGQGFCVTDLTGTAVPQPIIITNGSFDVPRVAGLDPGV